MSPPWQALPLEQAFLTAVELHKAGRINEAEPIYRSILKQNPNHAEALHLLALALHQNGQSKIALGLIKKAIRLQPTDAIFLNNLGEISRAAGKRVEAMDAYRKAIELKSDLAVAHNNLGTMLGEDQRNKEAIECYEKAITLNPNYAEAHNNLGNVLQKTGALDDAIRSFRCALSCNPGFALALNSLGNALQTKGQISEAQDCFEKAILLAPDYAEAHNNLGALHEAEGEYELAVACYRKAISLKQNFVLAHTNLGNALSELGLMEQAIHSHRKAIQLDRGNATARFNLSLTLLKQGNLEEGFALYENRFEGAQSTPPKLWQVLTKKPRWQGQALPGKKILVWAEQGLGDSLMMARFLPMLADKQPTAIYLACQPELTQLMETIHGIKVVTTNLPVGLLDVIDCHCPMLSLPYLFKINIRTIPYNVPYLSLPDETIEKWAERLAGISGKKVGIVWAGNPNLKDDKLRSIPLKKFLSIFGLKNITFISLQKNHAPKSEIDAPLLDMMDQCNDFLDTAGLVSQLDLVISVDTAVAHLAGALGKPVWLLSRFGSEWRWMADREDSPWYPTMRIFRQSTARDWGSVLERVAVALGKDTGAPSQTYQSMS